MAINDNAVITAAGGYVFVATAGTAAPTPEALDTLDPLSYGSQVHTIELTSGTATGGTWTATIDGDTTSALAFNATAAVVQAAFEALDSVGVGNVTVTGANISADQLVTFIGTLQGKAVTMSVEDASLTGSTPVLASSVTTALNGWKNVGHTSVEDMPEFGFDGGSTEVRRTWQNTALREVVTEQIADFVTLFLQQFDTQSLELYYGDNASVTPGVFGVSGDATTTEKAFLIIIIDGTVRLGFYAAKASVRRDDGIQLPVDDFASLPIRVTFLKLGSNDLYDWISLDLFD